MPIIIGGKITTFTSPSAPKTPVVEPVVETPAVTEQPLINIVVEPTTEEQKNLKRKYVVEKKKLKGVASNDTSLVVNGKKKSIGRKSKYLLDMLTLDSE